METMLHFMVVLISAIFLLTNYIFILPKILSLFDRNVKNIPVGKYYLSQVLQYSLKLGIIGWIYFAGICLIVIWFNYWATEYLNGKEKNNRIKKTR